MARVTNFLYNVLFRRNATMLATVFTVAFAGQLAFDAVSDKIWNKINEGRQWKDIKYRYVSTGADN